MTDFNKTVTDSIFAQARADRFPTDMTLDEAFETVLHMARELAGQDMARADRFPTERNAIDLVQSYFLMNVKG